MTTLKRRSMDLLEDEGMLVANVEHFNAFSKRSHDLFGIFDLLAVAPGVVMFVQVTSKSNASAHRRKMTDAPELRRVLDSGAQVELHLWAKVGRQWQVKRERML